jgi:antitoxin HicB
MEVDEAGFYLVTFPDVPEAGTDAETQNDAISQAADCLIAALGRYINAQRDIPNPSPTRAGQIRVTLPALVAAKLALYQTLREQGVTKVELGRQLGISEGAVRRLLDLDHRSHIGQVDTALSVLGKRLTVTVE